MNNDEFWALKIVALLHDPPGKALNLSGHETRSFAAIERIIGPNMFFSLFGEQSAQLQTRKDFNRLKQNSPNYQRLKHADAIASAMDRAGFPSTVKIDSKDYVPTACITHPLSGRERSLSSVPQQFCNMQGAYDQQAADSYQLTGLAAAERLASGISDLRSVFLRLWRELALTSPNTDTALLPPDTRIIDHSLWQHLDATSAVLSALPQPSLLAFSVGPVQSFIAEARRTQDLWMGSYILSYLTWRGIQNLIAESGPDSVLYPALRGQPLVDRWLYHDFKLPLPTAFKADDLSVATMPNKFIALLPASQAADLARASASAVRAAWLEMADAVKQRFPGGAQPGEWDRIWRRQVEASDWPEIYWTVLPWPDVDQYPSRLDEAKAAIGLDETYLGSPSPFRSTFDVYAQAWPHGVNSGTVYGRLHSLSEKGFDARKGLRHFIHTSFAGGHTQTTGEDGEKCTVSGVRSALRPNNALRREDVRRYWQSVSQDLRQPQKNRYHEVKPDGSERLSAIVAVKRFAQRDYFEQQIGLQGGFPSTSQVAAAPFKAAVLKQLADTNLQAALHEHIEGLKAIGVPTLSREAARLSLPFLTRICQQVPESLRSLAWELLQYDADVLYPTVFTTRRLEQDFGLNQITEQQANRLAESCRKLIRAARDLNIDPPATYYAVLMMDGDKMGAWLAGEGLPKFEDAFHAKARQQFQQLPDYGTAWAPILTRPRPISPSLHDSISAALANFALRCVRQVVEFRYPGRVVYAGGDDLLALLPADCALTAARELRALYSGEAEVTLDSEGNFEDVRIKFGDVNCTGYLELGDEVLLTIGPTATASVGIAIAHHQAPLDGVLAAAREAEEAAKESYGRNAVCVFALKRSGAPLRIGSQWSYDNMGDPMHLFSEIRDHFRKGNLSSKLAYDVVGQARALPISSTQIQLPGAATSVTIPPQAVRSSLERLLLRHKGDGVQTDEAKSRAKALSADLLAWAQALDQHRQTWETAWSKRHPHDEPDPLDEDFAPQPGAMELGNWLLLARFLERGGEE